MTYVRLFSHGINTVTRIYQWKLETHKYFPTENELIVTSTWIYMCMHIEPFDSDKTILENYVEKL